MARTVLAFMVKPLLEPRGKSFILRFIPVHTLTAEFLYSQIIEALQTVYDTGGDCIAIISDNHSVNRQTQVMLRSRFSLKLCDNINRYKIQHPCDSSKTLYLLYDTVHLFKSIRNNWVAEHSQSLIFYPPSSIQAIPVVAKWKDKIDL